MGDSVIFNPENGMCVTLNRGLGQGQGQRPSFSLTSHTPPYCTPRTLPYLNSYYTGWSSPSTRPSQSTFPPQQSPRVAQAEQDVAQQEFRLAAAKEAVLMAEAAITRTEAAAHRAWQEAQDAEESLARAEAARLQAIAEDEAASRAEALRIAEAEAASLARAATMAEDALKRVAMEADSLRKAAGEAAEAQKRAYADAEAVKGMTFQPTTNSTMQIESVLASISPAAFRMLVRKGAVSPTGELLTSVTLTEEEEDNCGSVSSGSFQSPWVARYLFYPRQSLSHTRVHTHTPPLFFPLD